jgi:hypothetical protein
MAEKRRGVGPGNAEVPPGKTEGPSLAEELSDTVASGRRLVAAEWAYQSLRAKLVGRALGWMTGAGALVLVLLFFTLMALVVGLLLALAPLLGAWGAMGAVMGGLLVAALIAAWAAASGLRRLKQLLREGKDSL